MHPVFTVFPGAVANDHDKVKGAVACVNDFVRPPHFTQRNFFSETGISMLNTAVDASNAVRHSSEFDAWRAFKVQAGPMIAELKSCREIVESRKKAVRDTRQHWFGAETVASSAAGEAVTRTTVRIADVVEVDDTENVEANSKYGLPCCSQSFSSLGKSKKRRVPVSPVAAKKNNFHLRVRLLAVLHLKLLLKRVLRSRVGKEVVKIVAMPQFSKGDINNNKIVYLYRLLAFEF